MSGFDVVTGIVVEYRDFYLPAGAAGSEHCETDPDDCCASGGSGSGSGSGSGTSGGGSGSGSGASGGGSGGGGGSGSGSGIPYPPQIPSGCCTINSSTLTLTFSGGSNEVAITLTYDPGSGVFFGFGSVCQVYCQVAFYCSNVTLIGQQWRLLITRMDGLGQQQVIAQPFVCVNGSAFLWSSPLAPWQVGGPGLYVTSGPPSGGSGSGYTIVTFDTVGQSGFFGGGTLNVSGGSFPSGAVIPSGSGPSCVGPFQVTITY